VSVTVQEVYSLIVKVVGPRIPPQRVNVTMISFKTNGMDEVSVAGAKQAA
jgi:hypothetical protein